MEESIEASMEASMEESLALGVLRQAIRERQPKAGLVHHTDRGGQYAGVRHRAMLRRASMKQSMSRADNCYDNAFMESCWSSFKRELVIAEYESAAAARKVVAEYVRYYRFERKHSSLGHLTHHQFAARTMAILGSWTVRQIGSTSGSLVVYTPGDAPRQGRTCSQGCLAVPWPTRCRTYPGSARTRRICRCSVSIWSTRTSGSIPWIVGVLEVRLMAGFRYPPANRWKSKRGLFFPI